MTIRFYAHDASILKLVAKNNVQVPFVLFQKQGVTRDLFRYVMSHVHAGLRFTDIEHLLRQMHYDRFVSLTPGYRQTTVTNATNGANLSNIKPQIDYPGRRLVINCFLRSYFELEHMYSHRMSELPCIWLSADHTFKVSANIGAWSQGVWVKQFDSLFTVLNEKGQVDQRYLL